MTEDLPRIELHLHLEGAAPPAFIRGLAAEKDVDLSSIFDDRGNYSYRDFNDFLRIYEAACTVLRTPDDFARLTRAVLEQSAAQGVAYTEIFVSPDFCGGRDLGAWRDYLAAIREAAGDVPEIEMRTIATIIRHFGPDAARETARCAAETAGDFVTGFGMGGDEFAGHPRDFAYAFDMAREAGLGLTSHAGEWGGAKSVRDTLDHLRVSRIGHGIAAIEDAALVERLARDGITLEVCPGSNVALRAVRGWRDHPVERLREAGVPLTVSTDDPPFFHTTMTHEHERLAETFGWERETFADIARTAARAAFCDEETRSALLARIDA
ncbi:adenosine deaminase [Palleronia sp. LCG004]|uniref:adenosine deaminase n=1 Tax=Palleronia sp. LCG004 TaxID=3079304 RepID=UPI00294328AD|nr:adenosine deaminase [Palleronia sp. LCG004]WOI56601.1 adenosine deaminase [Palleronia sp. LCG004]